MTVPFRALAPGNGQCIAVDIGVVAQDVDVIQGDVFCRRGRIGIRHRVVVHRRDRDRQRAGGRTTVAVGNVVADGIRAIEVQVRGVVQRPVPVHRDRAVQGTGAR